jgi:hypothetical protein
LVHQKGGIFSFFADLCLSDIWPLTILCLLNDCLLYEELSHTKVGSVANPFKTTYEEFAYAKGKMKSLKTLLALCFRKNLI